MSEKNAPRTYEIVLRNRAGAAFTAQADLPLLETLEKCGVDLPYGCRYGGCITCAAKLIEGSVDQSEGVALNGKQIRDGYVLLCVALPLSDCVIDVGVDSHDKLYRNPFANPLTIEELEPDAHQGGDHG